jgi:hypothetical protein
MSCFLQHLACSGFQLYPYQKIDTKEVVNAVKGRVCCCKVAAVNPSKNMTDGIRLSDEKAISGKK